MNLIFVARHFKRGQHTTRTTKPKHPEDLQAIVRIAHRSADRGIAYLCKFATQQNDVGQRSRTAIEERSLGASEKDIRIQ